MSLMDRKRNHFAADIISNLPCNVIDDILKCLPLADAVRTSVLSREWRYKWLTIPYLVFDMNFKDNLRRDNIDSIIYQVLVQHKGPIVKFIYDHNYRDRRHTISCQDNWLNFLPNHSIEELTLCLIGKITPQMMPHHICDHLRHLPRYHCELRSPLAFKGFDRLVKLNLHGAFKFMSFIPRFPMLEHLTLKGVPLDVPELEIDAPNLKSIYFIFRFIFPSICFKSTSFLEEVSIVHSPLESRPDILQGSQSNLIQFFGQLSSIKKLDIHCDYLNLLSIGGEPRKLRDNLRHVISLRCYIDFAKLAEVSGALCLIRSCPKLQSLETKSWTFDDVDMNPAVPFLKEQQNSKHTLSHLENVEIICFGGLEPEMEFVKLILSTATSLVKLKLYPDADLSPFAGKKSRILEELTRFNRASSAAEITIS